MLYDSDLQRGIRKKTLPEPNPTKVEMQANSTFLDMQQKAKQLYFKEFLTPANELIMADSGGMPILSSIDGNWTIGGFYEHHGFQPSRYKLYFMVDVKVSIKLLY